MGFIDNLVRSKGYKNFMAKLYGIGAAVVILGALFKILHLPGATIMLLLGMGTEAIIFIFSAFEPLHVEYDWTLVYPELAGVDGATIQHRERGGHAAPTQYRDAVSQQLDGILSEAHIGPELVESLGVGLQKLSDVANKLGSSADVSKANAKYLEEITKLTENLHSLNSIYETQLQASNVQLEAAEKAQASLQKMIELQSSKAEQTQADLNRVVENISGTLEDSERYKNEVAGLADKVSALHQIYGGTLAAMNITVPSKPRKKED